MIRKRFSMASGLAASCTPLLSTMMIWPVSALQAAPQQEAATEQKIERITVTANKRVESIDDVAGAVDAMSDDQLEALAANSLADYITKMPGVTFNNYQPGNSEVVIRGVASTTYHEQGQSVVGYYLNEISLSEPGWPITIPDIDTFDLQRVEVLRGPQGTLFGSASLGGLVNYVAKEADLSGFDAAIEAGLSTPAHSDDMGYTSKAMVNLPVSDTLAIRGVVNRRVAAGYTDNIGVNKEDTNQSTIDGGRLSVVWEPSAMTKLSWLSMVQNTDADDQPYVTLGTYTRDTYLQESMETKVQLHSLRFEHEFSFATLTMLGSYVKKDADSLFDYTIYYPDYLGSDTVGAPGTATSRTKSAEIRLASSGQSAWRWLIGAMYSKTDKHSRDTDVASGAEQYINDHPEEFGGEQLGAVLAPNDVFYDYRVKDENKETAVFGEMSYDLTPVWTATLGGRWFKTKASARLHQLPGTTGDAFDYNQDSDEDGFTPKFSLRYKPEESLMFYGLVSKGFRVGGPNPVPPSSTEQTPVSYDHDTTNNYEIGMRSDWLDHQLSFDATVFRIDWDDIQVRLYRNDGFAYVTNAGGARNQGLEVSLQWRPNNHWSFASNVTYLDAQLTEDLTTQGQTIADGATLPGASHWTIANTLTWTPDLPLNPRIMLTHSYLSAAPVAWESDIKRGNYNLYGLKASIMKDSYEMLFYVNNIFDEYGIVNAPFATIDDQLGTITQPRTVGVTVRWKY